MERSQSREKPSNPAKKRYRLIHSKKIRGALNSIQTCDFLVLHAPWLSTSCSLLQGKRGSGMSRKRGRPLPPFSLVDNAEKSSQAWQHLLSGGYYHTEITELNQHLVHNWQIVDFSTNKRVWHHVCDAKCFLTFIVTWNPWKSLSRLAFSSSCPILIQVSVTKTSLPCAASIGSEVSINRVPF